MIIEAFKGRQLSTVPHKLSWFADYKPPWLVPCAPAIHTVHSAKPRARRLSGLCHTRRFPQPSPFSSGQPSFCWSAFRTAHNRVEKGREEKKELMASDGMMTNTNWDWLTAKCTSTLRENVSSDGIRLLEHRAWISARSADFEVSNTLYLAAKSNMVELERVLL